MINNITLPYSAPLRRAPTFSIRFRRRVTDIVFTDTHIIYGCHFAEDIIFAITMPLSPKRHYFQLKPPAIDTRYLLTTPLITIAEAATLHFLTH